MFISIPNSPQTIILKIHFLCVFDVAIEICTEVVCIAYHSNYRGWNVSPSLKAQYTLNRDVLITTQHMFKILHTTVVNLGQHRLYCLWQIWSVKDIELLCQIDYHKHVLKCVITCVKINTFITQRCVLRCVPTHSCIAQKVCNNTMCQKVYILTKSCVEKYFI